MPSHVFSGFCDAVEEVYASCQPDTKIILVGDFNQPEFDWSSSTCVPINAASEHLMNLANFIHATQLNSVYNSRGVLLDLVFSTDYSLKVEAASDPLLRQEAYHPALELSLSIDYHSTPDSDVSFYDLRRCNVEGVQQWIESLNYPTLNNEDGANSFSNFCHKLGDCICRNSPLKKKTKSNFPHWFSSELRYLVINKKTLHKRYKITLSCSDYHAFKSARARCKTLTEICYKKHLNGIDGCVKDNPKSFWNHVKSLCKVNNTPSKLVYGQVSVDEPSKMCDLFAKYFTTVYVPHVRFDGTYSYESSVNLSLWYISAEEVERKLLCLDSSKGAGPDNVTPSVLKSCGSVIAPHLSIYFNHFLKTGIFPDVLKSGYLVPVHKSGDITNAENYRPIVIQSAIAKVFESLILDVLSFTFKNVIIAEQHGFCSGKSTITNLSVFTNYVYSAFSRQHQVDCVYLDFAKAFDRVSHTHLIAKLEALGITGPLLQWFSSYLTGRTLQVKFASCLSSSLVEVKSGVPQGSLLGPFLFSLFINDIGKFIDCMFLLFADDVKVYLEITSIHQQYDLQMSLNRISLWCQDNVMQLNVSKCQVMTFSRSKTSMSFDYNLQGSTLKRVTVSKDLGLHFTPCLDSGEHISRIGAKANRVLGLVARASRNAFSPATIRVLYVALVRPILEYGSLIWAPHQVGHTCSLDTVQKRFLRLMGVRSGLSYLDVNVQEIASQYGLISLSSRRIAFDLCFLYKVINGLIDCPELLQMFDIHIPQGTRRLQTFAKHHHRTAYAYHSTVPRLMRLGNTSQLDFFHLNFQVFRRQALAYVSGLN